MREVEAPWAHYLFSNFLPPKRKAGKSSKAEKPAIQLDNPAGKSSKAKNPAIQQEKLFFTFKIWNLDSFPIAGLLPEGTCHSGYCCRFELYINGLRYVFFRALPGFMRGAHSCPGVSCRLFLLRAAACSV